MSIITETPQAARMDLRAIGSAGQERDDALAAADLALDRVVDLVLAAGPNANVTLAARLAGCSKQTLYSRMEKKRTEAGR